MVDDLALANPLSLFLDKERDEFTRADLMRVVVEKGIERFTFHHTAIDGQLKELRLPFSGLRQAEEILAMGERVDGSSLFRGLVDASCSDLYVVPRYRTAFISPFDDRSLDFICRFLDRDGNLAPFTPDNILAIAHQRFRERTGLELHALGELEFFLLGEGGPAYFTPNKQVGYHASAPFFKSGHVVNEMVRHLAQITGAVKYAHAEVGFIDSVRSDLPMLSGRRAEQHEVEFNTRPIEEMGDFVALARWVIRNVADRHGMLATFAPKLEEGIAGNGFHFHLELVENGRNIMVEDGGLSEPALRLIGGLVRYAATLSAFGNTVASAFLRLVPNQEAPTRICWSDSNRSALIRVPLGWSAHAHLAQVVNPVESSSFQDDRGRQTVELRSPDGSALFHLLLAGITTAAEYGLTSEESVALAKATRVEGNVFSEDEGALERLEPLPGSCVACARLLEERRAQYEELGVFPSHVVDYVIRLLRRENDETLNRDLTKMSAEERLTATRNLMHRDIHRH